MIKKILLWGIVVLFSIYFYLVVAMLLLWPILSDFAEDYVWDQPPKNEDLEVVWTFESRPDIVGLTTDDNDTVFVQTEEGLYALDSQTGKQKWFTGVPGWARNHSPVYYDNKLVAVDKLGYVYMLDASSGELMAKSNGTYTSETFKEIEDILVDSEAVYVASFSHSLAALDWEGNEMWEYRYIPSRTSLYLTDLGQAVTLAGDQSLIYFDKQSGEILEEMTFKGYISSAYNDEEKLYIILSDGYRKALTAYSHQIPPRIIEVSMIPNQRVRCVTEVDNSILISGDGLTRINQVKCGELWFNGQIEDLSCPIVKDGLVYVRKWDRSLYIYDWENGDLLSHIPLIPRILFISTVHLDPMWVGSVLVVPNGQHKVVGYQY